ncbi:MAG: hypothetical protein R2724_07225 [Bryobacterales bacterium]
MSSTPSACATSSTASRRTTFPSWRSNRRRRASTRGTTPSAGATSTRSPRANAPSPNASSGGCATGSTPPAWTAPPGYSSGVTTSRSSAPKTHRPNESTLVEVSDARIEVGDEMIVFEIEASHFLWKMVRRIVGALVEVGRGNLALSDLERLLEGEAIPELPVAEWTAPPSGLFLAEVRYPESAVFSPPSVRAAPR